MIRPINSIDIDIGTQKASWTDYLRAYSRNLADLPKPQLIVGAGSQTHSTILTAGRMTGAPTVVLMSPPFGLRHLFDLCIVPEHDRVRGRNIITTQGALNRVQVSSEKLRHSGLILIGGPSKHHGWDDAQIADQIQILLQQNHGKKWTLTTSRRTPPHTHQLLSEIASEQLDFVPVEQTDGPWLPTQLAAARFVWVTEDSVSMVYEALSSGAKVGLLPVPRKKQSSRVVRGIDQLTERGQVLPFRPDACDLSAFNAPETINESGRMAQVVEHTFLKTIHPLP